MFLIDNYQLINKHHEAIGDIKNIGDIKTIGGIGDIGTMGTIKQKTRLLLLIFRLASNTLTCERG